MKTYVPYRTLIDFTRSQHMCRKFLNKITYCKIVCGVYYVGTEVD